MNFASTHVWAYAVSDEEDVSEGELEEGLAPENMGLSSSSDEDEDGSDCSHGSRKSRSRSRSPPAQSPKRKSGLFSFGGFLGFGGGSKAATDGAAPRKSSAAHSYSKKEKSQKKKKLRIRELRNASDPLPHVPMHTWRRADTNVVSIKFDRLTAPGDMHTGDPVYCTGCKSVFSHLSKMSMQGEEQHWICEFCGERNIVDLMDEEKPNKNDVTFMLQPAPSTTASGKSGTDESLVIFCVDVSGSMCVTTEVPGKIRLRGAERLDQLQSLNDTHESQRLPRQRRDVTYVSRLQGMQAGVDHQLGQMANEHPNRRPSLISFNNEVTVIGDGSHQAVVLSGDCLLNWDELVNRGTGLAVPQAIKDSRKTLGDKVFEMEEGGATALGPALLVSVAMASQVPGSKVIICTDGLANVGLGSLDVKAENFEQACQFYSDVSNYALEKGVSVSVLSIKGTDCKMVELGRVASATGGQVNIVDPLKLTQEFGSILSDPIIATNVTATFILHKGLYIRHEENEESRAVRIVGNVTAGTEITFEFGIRHSSKKQKVAHPPRDQNKDNADKDVVADAIPINPVCPSGADPSPGGSDASQQQQGAAAVAPTVDQLKELPFQLQITYTDLEGAEALRVLTQAKPVTKERNVAERALNLSVLGVHAAQTSAEMAVQGDYTVARLNAISHKRLLARHAKKSDSTVRSQYEAVYKNLAPIERRLHSVQQRERETTGMTYSDEECDEEDSRDIVADCLNLGAVPPPPPQHSLSRAAYAAPKKKHKSKALYSKGKRHAEISAASAISQTSAARKLECDDFTANVVYQTRNASSKDFK